jgi:Cu+-exporting ATPase
MDAMKKVMQISGMKCEHCRGRIERALNSLPGVHAEVSLKKKTAAIRLDSAISDDQMTRAVEAVGYKVVSIKEQKGWLGG